MTISIVVPVHNEAATLHRCLDAMVRGADAGELEIVVVCNGCTDSSAEIARSFGDPVRVLEAPVASKAEALNRGDAAAAGFPRFFVDADVVLPLASIRAVARALEQGEAQGASPGLRVRADDRSWPIRAYYDVWTRSPFARSAMVGCGVYALSERGRARFDAFPDLIADDAYVRLMLPSAERATIDDAWFEVIAPARYWSLVRIDARRRAGFLQIRQRFPGQLRAETRRQVLGLLGMAARPGRWAALWAYASTRLLSLLLHRWHVMRRLDSVWHRDETSRDAA